MGELCLNLPRSVVETGCKSEVKPIWMVMRHIPLETITYPLPLVALLKSMIFRFLPVNGGICDPFLDGKSWKGILKHP